MNITLSAFTFLQRKLKERGVDCSGGSMELPEPLAAGELAGRLGLEPTEVEAVFVNGKIAAPDTLLHDGDRVALVAPGTPGPYRALLGMVKLGPTS